MRLVHIPTLQELRKTATELMGAQPLAGDGRRDIDPGQTASGMVVIVNSLVRATRQTGADVETGDYQLVAAEGGAVLHAATRPPA